jgi:L-lactate dehydrogenase complex protein LldF
MVPTFDTRRYSELTFASTINGSCSNVCPVHINIHEQIYQWREEMNAIGEFSTTKEAAMKVADKIAQPPRGLPGGHRGRRGGAERPAAFRDLQPAQRLGTPQGRPEAGSRDVSPVVLP